MALMLDDDSLHLLGFGSDEILGLEGRARGDDLVGAVSAKIQQNPAFKQALMSRLATRQPLVQSNAPSKKRRQPIGLSYTFSASSVVRS
jgi:hypothetical protein